MLHQKGGEKHERSTKTGRGGHGVTTLAGPIAVEQYLKGVEFPAGKQELIDHAEASHAPEDVLFAFYHLDDRTYDSPIDVTQEVAKNE